MARRHSQYDPGSPQRVVDDAITEKFGQNRNPFFKAVGEASEPPVTRDSAKKAFYRLMAGEGLSEPQSRAYIALLGIDGSTLDELTPQRSPRVVVQEEVSEINRKLDLLIAHFGPEARPISAWEAESALRRLERLGDGDGRSGRDEPRSGEGDL